MIEVLKQMVKALEFFKELSLSIKEIEIAEEAIQAGKQAIAELESQEPVAWMYEDDYQRMLTSETFCKVWSVEVGSLTRGETTVPLYTRPPQSTWVDLTNDEIALIHADNPHPQGFARAVLAKSKEKNT